MTPIQDLQARLWRTFAIARDSGLALSEVSSYLLAVMLIKYLSDNAAAGAQDFSVPEKASWDFIRRQTGAVGSALNEAVHRLEDANHALAGVFGSVDFNDARAFGGRQEVILGQLVLELSDFDLSSPIPLEENVAGDTAQLLLDRIMDMSRGMEQHHSSRSVSELLAALLEPREGESICDPVCGFGGTLLACARYVKQNGGDPRQLRLYGQELVTGIWAMARINLLLHGLPQADIRQGDTLRSPQFVRDGHLQRFDVVLGQPPLGGAWGMELGETDPYGRFFFGTPSRGKGEMAFLQHFIASMVETGRSGAVTGAGILFRGGSEGRIRANILKADLLEMVVALPVGLITGARVASAALIFNRAKPSERRDKVLFVDASRSFGGDRRQPHLRDSDIARVVNAHRSFQNEEAFAHVATLEQIAAQDYDLSVSRYVVVPVPDVEGKITSPEEALAQLREAEAERAEAAELMDHCLRVLGVPD